MGGILLTILGIVIGILSTYLVSRYYFKRSLKETELTPFLFFGEQIYYNTMDDDIQNDLKILYKDQVLSNLYQLQFIIANTGDLPILDCIKPLSFQLPGNSNLIDHRLAHVNPEGRELNIKIDGNRILFLFDLLNPGEYFIFNLLLNEDDVNKNEESILAIIKSEEYQVLYRKFHFEISSKNLPPQLKCKDLPEYYLTENEEIFNEKIDVNIKDVLKGGLFTFLSILLFSYVLVILGKANERLNILNSEQFFEGFDHWSIIVVLAWGIVLVGGFIYGFILLGLLFIRMRSKGKTKFRLPDKYTKEK